MKNVNRIITICLLTLLLSILSACTQEKGTEQIDADTLKESENTEQTLSFRQSLGVTFKGVTAYVQSTESGEFLLCLPSGFKYGTLVGDCFTVAGKVIKDGERVTYESISDGFEFEHGGETVSVRVLRSENVPSLFLTSDDGDFSKINASTDHSYSSGGFMTVLSENGVKLYSGTVKKIRGRGNATWNVAAKKPYQIQLSGSTSLLGLTESDKYVLLANYYDRSLLRNATALKLAAVCADSYEPDFTFVDLFASGEYLGAYLLCEKIEIGNGKISITDLEEMTVRVLGSKKAKNFKRGGDITSSEAGSAKWYELPAYPEDITGGYLLEVDFPERYGDTASGFVTERGLTVTVKSPEYASRAQVDYIKEYFCDFEDALYSEDGYNEKGRYYSDYADIDSLAFRYLFEEYMLNIDGGLGSFVIFKDSDKNGGKLNFSCVWDYDCALGNYNKYIDLTNPETLFTASMERRDDGKIPNLFCAAMKHEDFRAVVNKYYKERFAQELEKLPEFIKKAAEKIKTSAALDEKLYGTLDGHDFYMAQSGNNFTEACDYLLDFVQARTAYFTTVFGLTD